jgi:hypothetical protein
MKLLPQEQDMFPETIQRHSPPGSADDILSLPNKATCTVQEASVATGVSQSQIKYWVEDGTLLAINSARHPVSGQHRRKNERNRWRIVVRRAQYQAQEYKAFLTLEELIPRITNLNS